MWFIINTGVQRIYTEPLFDSELGAKPIRGNEAQGPDLIQAKFEAIFKEALPKDESIDEITLVILNALVMLWRSSQIVKDMKNSERRLKME